MTTRRQAKGPWEYESQGPFWVIGLGDAREPADSFRSLVVDVGLLRAVVEGDERDAIQRVVGVGGLLVLGVCLRDEIAGVVVYIHRVAGVRACLPLALLVLSVWRCQLSLPGTYWYVLEEPVRPVIPARRALLLAVTLPLNHRAGKEQFVGADLVAVVALGVDGF